MTTEEKELQRAKAREAKKKKYWENPMAANAITMRWRKLNRDKINAYNRKRRPLIREHLLALQKQSYLRNKDKITARTKAYLERTRDERRRARAAYYQRNKARICAAAKAWRDKNKDRCTKNRVRWIAANKEAVRQSKLKWARANPENLLINKHNRRAKEYAGGRLSKGLRQRLLFSQGAKCAACLCDLNESGNHMDHIVPLARGGINIDENIQLLCPSCNHRKSARSQEAFLAELRAASR